MENTAIALRLKNYGRVAEAAAPMPSNYEPLLGKREKEKITLSKMVFLYLLGGFIGTLWETILNFVRGDGFVYCNGSLFTLFNPVYGFGAIMIVLALGNYKNPLVVFGIGCLVGALVEMLLSLLEEAFLGTRSWDYTGDFLNIAGRTTVPLAMLWGALCLVVICYLFPSYNRFLCRIPHKILRSVSAVVLCVVIADFACTALVLFRYSDRMQGKTAQNNVERFIDEHFGDVFMSERFPQMKNTGDGKIPSKGGSVTDSVKKENTADTFFRRNSKAVDTIAKKGYTLCGCNEIETFTRENNGIRDATRGRRYALAAAAA